MRTAPSKTGSNWVKETHGERDRWSWEGDCNNYAVQYVVQSFEGPGIPLYALWVFFRTSADEPWIELKHRRQLKKPAEMFRIARQFHDHLRKFTEGGMGLIISNKEWQRIGGVA